MHEYYPFSEKIWITLQHFLYLNEYYCESDVQLSKLRLQLFRGVENVDIYFRLTPI